MKKRLFILAATVLSLPLFAQLSFYGDYTASATASVRQDGYDTALNPQNDWGLNDVNLANSLVVKMAGGDELADLELWFSLDQYPVGAGLIYAAGGDPTSGDGALAAAFSAEAGDYIYTFDLMRASVGWSFGEDVLVRLGRQSLLTGYGYGWNPMDFANPAKDPADPKAELRGVDALAVQLFPYSPANLKVYGTYDRGLAETGADYDELMGGGELTVSLPALELKGAGFIERDGTAGEDSRVSALGAGFLADVAGAGVYGEGALLYGSRNQFSDGAGTLDRKDGLLFSALAGVEYVFLTETSLVAEYFYNGEGYDRAERDNILTDLENSPSYAATYASLYRPGYYSRHYVLLNLSQPLYAVNTDVNLTVLYSADSGALSLMPGVNWNGSGSFTLSGKYAGLMNLTGEDSSENALAPVKHAFAVEGKFSY